MTRICTVPGCEEPVLAAGYCATHYHRDRRTGSPQGAAGPGMSRARLRKAALRPWPVRPAPRTSGQGASNSRGANAILQDVRVIGPGSYPDRKEPKIDARGAASFFV